MNPVARIEKILLEETELYSELYGLEEGKSAAIIERNGKLLESVSQKQEQLLGRIAALEAAREKHITEYAEINRLDDLPRAVTLRDIVLSMDEDASHRLLRAGMDLKKLLLRLDSLNKTNRTLIEDNLEFFNILLSGLKNTVSVNVGYSDRGLEKPKVGGSLLFNKTV